VTNKMYALCVAGGECDPPNFSKSSTRQDYYGNPEYGDFPVVYVTWSDANTYCTWADRRLPTESEWEKAASWDDVKGVKNIYPWGNTIDCSLANYYDGKKFCTGDTTAVGAYSNGKSTYGAFNMAGNVWEWVSDWSNSFYYSESPSSNPQGPQGGSYRVIRGGSWGFSAFDARASNRNGYLPSDDFDYVGFRCARSP